MLWSLGMGSVATYAGEWRGSLREGEGGMVWDFSTSIVGDECFYDGNWKGGLRQGKGKMRFPGGHSYVGQFEHDQRAGKGRMTWAIGDEYEGEWRGDRPEGVGTIRFVTGDIYRGRILKGQRHGRGIFTYANGDVYDGEWQQDRKEGRGALTHAKNGGTTVSVSYYKHDEAVGDGVRYDNERQKGWTLSDGHQGEEIELKKALGIFGTIGLPFKNPPRPNAK